jgi:hypothetical protein
MLVDVPRQPGQRKSVVSKFVVLRSNFLPVCMAGAFFVYATRATRFAPAGCCPFATSCFTG